MKLIKPKFEILEQAPGLKGVKEQIELAGRTCYKSENRITEGSAEKFVDNMVKSGHGAMLEHGTVYLRVPDEITYSQNLPFYSKWEALMNNKYTKAIKSEDDDEWFITTNYRVLVENGWLDTLEYQCEPTEYHEKRITVRFTCDRGVTHEFVRHKLLCVA